MRIAPFFLIAAFAFEALAEPSPSFDHSLWDRWLKRHVRDGLIEAEALPTDARSLDAYLTQASRFPKESFSGMDREDRIAFLINVHNAAMVRSMIHSRLSQTDRAAKEAWKPLPPDKTAVDLFGREIAAGAMADEMLLRTFRDERIHAALFRGWPSGPALRGEAYRGAEIDRMLDEDARRFVNDPERNRIEVGARKIYLSPVFQEHARDFIMNYGTLETFRKFSVAEMALLSFLAHYADPAKRAYLEEGRYRIQYLRREGGRKEALHRVS